MSCTLERDDDGIFILNLGDGDNRFNADTVAAINAHFDTVEQALAEDGGSAALVTTADNKIWHNGLDLDWMAGIDDAMGFVSTVDALIGRAMRLPLPTIAAIGGHAFAGGAIFSLGHDMRIMRADRGFFCLPEVDLKLTFGAGFSAIIAAKVPSHALTPLAILGERMGAERANQLGIVDRVAPDADHTRAAAMKAARKLAAKPGAAVAALRAEYYGDAIDALFAGRGAGSAPS